jgi:hypothetical protein
MEGFIVLLAATFDDQVKAVTHGSRFSSKDILTALTIGLAVGFSIFAWVYGTTGSGAARPKDRFSCSFGQDRFG